MATVDHLGAMMHVRILRAFSDAEGNRFSEGETGRIRTIELDWKTFQCTIFLEQGDAVRKIVLHDGRRQTEGPKSGNLREYFEAGDVEVLDRDRAGWPPGVGVNPVWIDDQLVAPAPAPVPPSGGGGPTWLAQARAMERAGQFKEMEELVRDSIPYQAFALEVASLYRERWRRLNAEGDVAGAQEARRRSADWAYFYASQATSGGEGTAMSMERNQFLKTLGPEPYV